MNKQITKLVLVCGLILSINLKGIQAQKLPGVHFEEWKQTEEGLEVTLGKVRLNKNGYALKIAFESD